MQVDTSENSFNGELLESIFRTSKKLSSNTFAKSNGIIVISQFDKTLR